MSNFEYIIASLPFLTVDYKYAGGQGFADVIEEIRRDLSEKDASTLDFLLKGFQPESLGEEFYREASTHQSKFVREYFGFDLNLRNAKVRYLNHQLGRDPETDIVTPGEETEEFEEAAAIDNVLSGTDLIAREKGLDDITWKKVESLSTFHYFDLTAVLAYVAKLHIVDRWLALDEEQGRELFHKLVKEVRGTFKGVKYEQ